MRKFSHHESRKKKQGKHLRGVLQTPYNHNKKHFDYLMNEPFLSKTHSSTLAETVFHSERDINVTWIHSRSETGTLSPSCTDLSEIAVSIILG